MLWGVWAKFARGSGELLPSNSQTSASLVIGISKLTEAGCQNHPGTDWEVGCVKAFGVVIRFCLCAESSLKRLEKGNLGGFETLRVGSSSV